MKKLTITYGGLTLVDTDVSDFSWQDGEGQVQVSARWKAAKPAASSGGGILDLISSVSKQRTQAVVEKKRQEAAEVVPEDSDPPAQVP